MSFSKNKEKEKKIMKRFLFSTIFLLNIIYIVMAKPTFILSPEQRIHNTYNYISTITFFIGMIWIFFGIIDLIKALKEKNSKSVLKLMIGLAIIFICGFMDIVESSKHISYVVD